MHRPALRSVCKVINGGWYFVPKVTSATSFSLPLWCTRKDCGAVSTTEKNWTRVTKWTNPFVTKFVDQHKTLFFSCLIIFNYAQKVQIRTETKLQSQCALCFRIRNWKIELFCMLEFFFVFGPKENHADSGWLVIVSEGSRWQDKRHHPTPRHIYALPNESTRSDLTPHAYPKSHQPISTTSTQRKFVRHVLAKLVLARQNQRMFPA